MKIFILALILLTSCVVPVHADYMVDFIRITFIEEARFLDIEYRAIHNNAVDAYAHRTKQGKSIWEKNNFFAPGELTYNCSFPESKYKIVVNQRSASAQGQCGAAPEITFSLYRNGEVLIKDVVFGYSCFGNPSIKRISIQDGEKGRYCREVEICFLNGNHADSPKCEWFFDTYGAFQKNFPMDQKSIERRLKRDGS